MKIRHTPVDPSEIIIGAPLAEAIWQDPDTFRASKGTARDLEFLEIRDALLANVGIWRLLVAYDDIDVARRLTHRVSNGSAIWGPKGLFKGALRTVANGKNTYYYVYAKAVEPGDD
jgi:hypothetical protein